MPSRCDVIIPVKDSAWWVDWCLQELFRHTDPALLGEVLVVDDGSSAESHAVLRRIVRRHEGARLVMNGGRPGFGGACNFAVGQTRSPHFLLLNTDCLITPGVVSKLMAVAEHDPTIGLACPLSNNSPVLTLPLSPGRSYLEMNRLLDEAFATEPLASLSIDACTVVGNCLLITRRCWDATGEFDAVWGLGYGEETDFQFRAMEKGFRGVAVPHAYVFHFGSASFRYQTGIDEMKTRALALFDSKWGSVFREYAQRCAGNDPVGVARQGLVRLGQQPVELDVLFVLPGITQGVGGIHVALDVCNHLIRRGLRAACSVLGQFDPSTLQHYQEPILAGLLHFSDETHLLDESSVSTRVVVATLFSTVPAVHTYSRLSGARMVNWIQGYEFYFENGMHWDAVEEGYRLTDEFLTTSSWLQAGVTRHQPTRPVTRLPLGLNGDVFHPGDTSRVRNRLRVAIVLRASADKGQWILQEVIHRLWAMREHVTLLLLRSPLYPTPPAWAGSTAFEEILLPVGRELVADALRDADVLVDASLHEGFGLLPLEAMACGATVVVSASGGVQDFVHDRQNGFVINEALNPDAYLRALGELIESPEMLARLRASAQETGAGYTAGASSDAYVEFFRDRRGRIVESRNEVLFSTGEERGYPGIVATNDLLVIGHPGLLLTTLGTDPAVLLPAVSARRESVLRVEINSAVQTSLQVFLPAPVEGPVAWTRAGMRRLLTTVSGEAAAAKGLYREELSVIAPIEIGRNTLYLPLPPLSRSQRLRLDPANLPGQFLLESLEIREVRDGEPRLGPAEARAAFEVSDRVIMRVGATAERDGLTALKEVDVEWIEPCLRSLGQDPQLSVVSPPAPPGSLVCVEVDLHSSRETQFQVFYGCDGDGGYSEQRSVRRRVRVGHNRFRILLRETRMNGHFRIDPSTVAGDLHLHHLEVRVLGDVPREVSASG